MSKSKGYTVGVRVKASPVGAVVAYGEFIATVTMPVRADSNGLVEAVDVNDGRPLMVYANSIAEVVM